MKYLQSALLCLFLVMSLPSRAGEGMWLPHLLAALNESEMQAMGMKMTAEDIYSVNRGSLKDAIIHFGGFCTGEIISNRGLILTNHHCGYSQIQSHTTLENNYLRDGFWARSLNEELTNPGLFARFIIRIEDVSTQVFKGVKRKHTATERQSIIDKNLESIKTSYQVGTNEEIMMRPFFKGNQYILFLTKTYHDVRLVGAPPESIGKFGHDTDNWVWPRHTGDFSLFRVYADSNGEPADYAEGNVPLVPKHALPISLDGTAEGDFTMVFGFPGRTDEYLPGKAVDITANQINPVRIAIRESAMVVMDAAMKADDLTKIKYASKFARLANYWKKWIGESTGLKRTKALERKNEYERDLHERTARNKKLGKVYGHVLPELNQLYDKMAPYLVAQATQSEGFNRHIEAISLSNVVQRLMDIYENNGQAAFDQALPRYKNYLEGQYKNFDANVDLSVCKALLAAYLKYMPSQFIDESLQTEIDNFIQINNDFNSKSSLLFHPSEMLDQLAEPDKMKVEFARDPLRALILKVNTNYKSKVAGPLAEMEIKREALMRSYMDLQMKALKHKKLYPDANGTMRITYGKVDGYVPRDGVRYSSHTYLEGVIEKYKPNDWEFDLPQKLLDLYKQKNYGAYADDGKLPICFIGTNHTTGGNSGSPAIDAHGNLVGLNFDRVWEGTMSDLNYDASICRNIMVDIRYVLFIIDKFADAQNIINELNLVHSKSN